MARQTEQICGSLPHLSITPFGVDLDWFPANSAVCQSEQITIGTVKSLKSFYGIDLLIRAFASCRRIVAQSNVELSNRLRLMIVGDGVVRQELEALARDCGIMGVTTFVGAVPHEQVRDYLAKLDVYVAMSRRESFGVAVLEASACGKPVVVSDVGGLPEVVQEGHTGFIVASGDIDALADRLVRLITSPELSMTLGQQGRRFVEDNYDWEDSVQRMIDVYDRVHLHSNASATS
jgi:glycosyltransferase involved in cell wall biosynthesis